MLPRRRQKHGNSPSKSSNNLIKPSAAAGPGSNFGHAVIVRKFSDKIYLQKNRVIDALVSARLIGGCEFMGIS
jgi:hypothetical protein